MAFAVDTWNVKYAHSWAEAHALFDKLKPWKTEPDTMRPIAGRKKKHLCIVRDGEDYMFRLYRTDMVTYHKNGDVSFYFDSRQSSTSFINHAAPHGFENIKGNCVEVRTPNGMRIYTCRSGIRWQKVGTSWVPDKSMLRAFVAEKVNRQRANEVKEAIGYNKFVAWRAATEAMGVSNNTWTPRSQMLDLLAAGPSQWYKLLVFSNEIIRESLYRTYKVYDEMEHPYAETWRQVERWGQR